MDVPLSVVTWLPAAFGSFQSIAMPTPARSVLQLERWVVHVQLPLMVTVLPFTLAVAPAMSGASAAARAGTASVTNAASNPPRSRRLKRVDGIRHYLLLQVNGPALPTERRSIRNGPALVDFHNQTFTKQRKPGCRGRKKNRTYPKGANHQHQCGTAPLGRSRIVPRRPPLRLACELRCHRSCAAGERQGQRPELRVGVG